MGSKKRPFYRIIATDSRMPRDGRFIESIGYYNPVSNPAVVQVDEQLAFKWFERGAQPTTSAASLLRQVGCLQKWELMKQGLSGEALEKKMEAVMAQRAATAAEREARKQAAPSKKAQAKAAAEAEKQAAEAPAAEAPAEAEKQAAEAPAAEAPAEAEKQAAEAPAPEAPAEAKEPAEAETPAPEASGEAPEGDASEEKKE